MRTSKRAIVVLSAVVALSLAGMPAAGAQGAGPQIKVTQVDNSRFPQVTIYVSVTDAAGKPVGVDPSSLRILENGEPMNPTEVSGGGQGGIGPLTTMLVMDVSGSMDKNGKIDGARAASKAYVDQMRPGDQAGLMVYNTRTTYAQPLTQDQQVLRAAIDNIQTGGDTAMYDALFAAEEALRNVPGRKAILAVTDGLDNSSSHDEDSVMTAIGPSGLSISTIGLGDASSREQVGLDEAGLRSLAQRAGGAYSFASDAEALSALFQAYARELQSEYAISYMSPTTLRDGVNRQLTVSLASGGAATVESKYNPGGVLPEVGGQSWVLFAALLLGLVALLVAPLLLGTGARLFRGGGGRKRVRIKLGGEAGARAPSMARGRVKFK